MRALWDDEVPGACDSTLLIAERVQPYDDVWAPKDRMPVFPVPDGPRPGVVAAPRGRRRAGAPVPGRPCPQEYTDRAEYEIKVICDKGFPSYFLIVADLINYARSVDIRVGPGPWFGGRIAGRLRAWASPTSTRSRTVCCSSASSTRSARRCPTSTSTSTTAAAARCCATRPNKWGSDRVAQVITFGTIKTKAALKDSARVHYGQPGLRHRRPDHQGAAAADHGQGHPAVGHHRSRPTSGTRKPPRSAACSTPTPTSAPSTRPRAAWRAWSATPACTPAR